MYTKVVPETFRPSEAEFLPSDILMYLVVCLLLSIARKWSQRKVPPETRFVPNLSKLVHHPHFTKIDDTIKIIAPEK